MEDNLIFPEGALLDDGLQFPDLVVREITKRLTWRRKDCLFINPASPDFPCCLLHWAKLPVNVWNRLIDTKASRMV